jgi:hypothetical protein
VIGLVHGDFEFGDGSMTQQKMKDVDLTLEEIGGAVAKCDWSC